MIHFDYNKGDIRCWIQLGEGTVYFSTYTIDNSEELILVIQNIPKDIDIKLKPGDYINDIIPKIKFKDVNGVSISFKTRKDIDRMIKYLKKIKGEKKNA